jgi:hypothetical protein
MRALIPIAVASLLLGGCADSKREMEAANAAHVAYVDCLRQAAARLDDRRSDALAVAEAVRSACRDERLRLEEVMGAKMPLHEYALFKKRMQTATLQTATDIVSTERKQGDTSP